jgi:predicted lactoylglutathione lyase
MKWITRLFFLIMLLAVGCQTEQKIPPDTKISTLGDYLQVSLSVHDIDLSLNFYSTLGFKVLTAERTAVVPWAIMADGTNLFMLSQNEFPSPAFTYFTDNFEIRIQTFQNFRLITDGTARRKTAIANDPNGVGITLIDLETQYLPRQPAGLAILPGTFKEFSLPVLDLATSQDFWLAMGFKPSAGSNRLESQISLSDNLLTIGLYPKTGLPSAALTYQTNDLAATHRKLISAGLAVQTVQSEINNELIELRLISPDDQLLRMVVE